MRRPALLAALVPVLALAACADLTWHKAGSDAEATRGDLGACQANAHNLASRANPALPPVTIDRRFGGNIDGPLRPTETRLREQELVDACMKEKGYALVPATS